MKTQLILKRIAPMRTPLLILVLVTIATLFGSQYLFQRIMFLRGEVKALREQNVVFQDRVSVLQIVEPELVSAPAQTAVNALPSQNPSLLVVSQLKRIAKTHDLTIDRLEINIPPVPPTSEKPAEVVINFLLSGDYQALSSFIFEAATITPLVNIQDVEIQAQEQTEAIFELVAYWSPLPQKLPSLTQAITGLTEEEKSIINSLSQFTNPTIPSAPKAETYPLKSEPYSRTF